MSELKNQLSKMLEAIMRGDFIGVRTLLEDGANPNTSEDSSLNTPLHFAISFEQYAIAKLLIEFGADPKARNSEKITPISLAIHFRDASMIKLLLKRMYQH